MGVTFLSNKRGKGLHSDQDEAPCSNFYRNYGMVTWGRPSATFSSETLESPLT